MNMKSNTITISNAVATQRFWRDRTDQRVESIAVPEPSLIAYYWDATDEHLLLRECMTLKDISQPGMKRLVTLKPLLTVKVFDNASAIPEEARVLIGKKVTACPAAHYIVRDGLALDIPQMTDMVSRLGGQLYVERMSPSDAYKEFEYLLSVPKAKKRYRREATKAIKHLAESLAPTHPHYEVDCDSTRIRRALSQEGITTLSDLAKRPLNHLMRIEGLSAASLEQIFIRLIQEAKHAQDSSPNTPQSD